MFIYIVVNVQTAGGLSLGKKPADGFESVLVSLLVI